MKLALNDIPKSVRGEECSTERRSNKSGYNGLKPDERNKLRDLRSIFMPKYSKNEPEKKSARNQSTSKILSKTSSASLKLSRKSSNKKSFKKFNKDASPLKEDSKQATIINECSQEKLLNFTNPFSKTKSLLRGSKSRKKRAENIVINGAKKIKLDKIKFKSPKAHSLGKKLSKIKLNRRENKFMKNQFDSNANHNSSNLNSARSKGNAGNDVKESKKSLKVVKQEYILKSGEAKLRFSSKVKDNVPPKPNFLTKNPLKVLKKIPPEREKATIDTSAFSIPIDRVCQYNNFCKLSGRTKQSSDSGSNFMVRK